MNQPQPSFWRRFGASLLGVLKWFAVKVIAPLLGIIVVLGAIVLVAFGAKELQIGGLLSKLLKGFLNRTPPQQATDIVAANSVVPTRVDPKGNIIQPGTPDSKGDTQAVVVPIEDPGLFSDPNTVTFTPPGSDKSVEVQLPDGVSNKDVQQVIVVRPDVVAVTVKDTSGIPAQTVDALLKKYAQ